MISLLGSPKIPLTTNCQNDRASTRPVLRTTVKISSVFSLTGIKPAAESAKKVVTGVFAETLTLKEC